MKTALIIMLAVGVAAAEPATYARESRVATLGKALAALRALGAGRAMFEQDLHARTRERCHDAPTVACLIEVARAECKDDACAAAADIVITNQHAETALVDEVTRMRLVRTATDYHAAITAELWSRYAVLAAELALAQPGSDAELPARIDRFCADRDRVAHPCDAGTACVGSVAWQRCAAGLVWFIAGHEGAPPSAGSGTR